MNGFLFVWGGGAGGGGGGRGLSDSGLFFLIYLLHSLIKQLTKLLPCIVVCLAL